jgi:assimilatory nitrate reductase catalytic subunit
MEAICDLAARLGRGSLFSYSGPRDVFEELRQASKGGVADYSGITYERIEQEEGVFWPCPSEGHPGTPRLFTERFATPSGRAVFHTVRHHVPAEQTDAEFPLTLTTGRIKAHYQSGTQTRRVGKLAELAPRPHAEMHPSTAARHGLANGDGVVLTSRRGRMTAVVKTTHGIRPDTVFVPFHWGGDGSVNRLTNPALDPVSRMPEFKACAVRIEPAGKE